MKGLSDVFIQRKNSLYVKPIYLYAIQYDETANKWLYWTSASQEVVFDGITYKAYAINHNKLAENASGRSESISLTVGNYDREIQYYIDTYDGLRKKKCVIKLVFADALDVETCYDEFVYYIDDCTANRQEVVFSLSSQFDVLDVKLPRGRFNRGYCRFRFKSPECGYTGSEASCNKLVSRCRELENFGRFGAFPAIPMKRIQVK